MHRHWLGQIVESFLMDLQFQESAPVPMHDRKLRPGPDVSRLPVHDSDESSCHNRSQFPHVTAKFGVDPNYLPSKRLSSTCSNMLIAYGKEDRIAPSPDARLRFTS